MIKLKLPEKYKELMKDPEVRKWLENCEAEINKQWPPKKIQQLSDDLSSASIFGVTCISMGFDGKYICYPKHGKLDI